MPARLGPRRVDGGLVSDGRALSLNCSDRRSYEHGLLGAAYSARDTIGLESSIERGRANLELCRRAGAIATVQKENRENVLFLDIGERSPRPSSVNRP